MRIGLVNEYFPPFAPGGAEWSVLALARGLSRSHHVVVVTPNYGAQGFEALDGARVYRFPFRARMQDSETRARTRWLANPLFYIHSAKHIAQVAREERLDILHAQNKYSLPGAWLASRRLGLPVVFTVRDTLMICPLGTCLMMYDAVHPDCGRFRHWWHICRPEYIDLYLDCARRNLRLNTVLTWLWLDTRLRRWFLRRVDGVVGVSKGILDVYSQAGVLAGLRTRAIYNVPPNGDRGRAPEPLLRLRERWEIGVDQKVVLFAGRLTHGKGVHDLVVAADIVVRQVPQAVFLFAGRGDLRPSGPHTRILGNLPHEDLMQLYHAVDVVAVPSRQPEPLSRVGLEAMAARRPLVGTRVGGTPELIDHGVNGLLVERGNVDQLAEALCELLLDHARRREMGEASGRLIRTRFAPQRSLEAMIDFYRETIDLRSVKPG